MADDNVDNLKNREQSQTHRIVEHMLDEIVLAINEVRTDMKSKRMDGEILDDDLQIYVDKIRLSGKLNVDVLKYLTHDRETHLEFDDE